LPIRHALSRRLTNVTSLAVDTESIKKFDLNFAAFSVVARIRALSAGSSRWNARAIAKVHRFDKAQAPQVPCLLESGRMRDLLVVHHKDMTQIERK
jgi:hypothetical protein